MIFVLLYPFLDWTELSDCCLFLDKPLRTVRLLRSIIDTTSTWLSHLLGCSRTFIATCEPTRPACTSTLPVVDCSVAVNHWKKCLISSDPDALRRSIVCSQQRPPPVSSFCRHQESAMRRSCSLQAPRVLCGVRELLPGWHQGHLSSTWSSPTCTNHQPPTLLHHCDRHVLLDACGAPHSHHPPAVGGGSGGLGGDW